LYERGEWFVSKFHIKNEYAKKEFKKRPIGTESNYSISPEGTVALYKDEDGKYFI